MKRIALLTIASFCLFSIANSQITKGSLFLGGSLGISSGEYKSTADTSKSSFWYFNPVIGIAIKENSIAGIFLGYGRGTGNDTEIEQNNYNAGLFFRKYKPLGKGFYLFGEGNLSYYHNLYEQDDPVNGYRLQKNSGITLGIFPGLSYAVGKRFYLETALTNLLSISYSKASSETKASSSAPLLKDEQSNFGMGVGAGGNIPINLGFRFIFPKK
jgi:hypothetical protein